MDFTRTLEAIKEYYRACQNGPGAFDEPGPQQIPSLQARWFDRTVAMHTLFVRGAFLQECAGRFTTDDIARMKVTDIQGHVTTLKAEARLPISAAVGLK